MTFGTRNGTLVLNEAHTQISSTPILCQEKCAKMLPFWLQQLAIGAVPLNGQWCNLYNPKRCMLVVMLPKGTTMNLLGVDKV